MKKKPTKNVRMYGASYKRFKMQAAAAGTSLMELLDRKSKGV